MAKNSKAGTKDAVTQPESEPVPGTQNTAGDDAATADTGTATDAASGDTGAAEDGGKKPEGGAEAVAPAPAAEAAAEPAPAPAADTAAAEPLAPQPAEAAAKEEAAPTFIQHLQDEIRKAEQSGANELHSWLVSLEGHMGGLVRHCRTLEQELSPELASFVASVKRLF